MARLRTTMGQPPAPIHSWFEDCVKVIRQGESLPLPAAATLTLEDGTMKWLTDRLPEDLPVGYHRLVLAAENGAFVRLIVTPGRCHLPDDLRIWGWSAQLYATRSRNSWGMGDLGHSVA